MAATGTMKAKTVAERPSDDISEIADLQTQFEIFRFLRRFAERCGFGYFLVLKLPGPTSLNLAENSVITNWPADFLAAYDRMELFPSSPVMRRLKDSVAPFAFSFSDLAAERCGQGAARATRLYCEFGLRSGLCVPVHDAKGSRSAVVFGGDRDMPGPAEIGELTLIAIHAFQRLTEVTGTLPRQEELLTARELDCLSWTAAGKTSADIAQILALSEHTVNHYLNRAARKLDTVNRTQAVAKALRRGLIA